MASIFTVKFRVGSVNGNKQKVGGMVRQLKENGGLKKLGKQRIIRKLREPRRSCRS